jgi:hypothetical protein
MQSDGTKFQTGTRGFLVDVVHAYRQAVIRDDRHPRAEVLGVAGGPTRSKTEQG